MTFGTFVGVAGCSTQSLVPTDGGGARTGSGGGTGNRSGGTAAETGTDSGAGGIVGTTGAGGTVGTRGVGGAIGPSGAGGIVGTTGAAGFGRPSGGAAGFGVGGVGGGAGRGRPPIDASTTTPPQDAGDCQCVIGADGVLRMSWDCFSTNYQNGAPMAQWCSSGGPGGWVSSCGFEIFKLNRDNPAIPDDEWVYDATGATVGQQIAEMTPVFVCPSDLSLKAAVVAGGQFPPSSCAVTDCSCGDAGAVSCPVPDGGGSLPGLPIF